MEIAENSVSKKRLRTIIVWFVVVLIMLTLFSNTLLHYSLPKVGYVSPITGALSPRIDGVGIVEAADKDNLFVKVNWSVEDIRIKVGDEVVADQLLVKFNTEEAEQILLDEKDRYEQHQIRLKQLQRNYVDAVVATNDIVLDALKLDIRNVELDMKIAGRQVRRLEQQLLTSSTLRAPYDGIVTEVNAMKGLPVPGGVAAVKLANKSKGQMVKVTINPNKAKYLSIDLQIDLIVAALDNARIPATLTKMSDIIVNGVSKKQLVFLLNDDRLRGGEQVKFSIVQTQEEVALLLPSQAVRAGDKGLYVLVLQEKKGPLGREFYVQKALITKGDSDDSNTIIESGITPLDKVIMSESRSLEGGERVMLLE